MSLRARVAVFAGIWPSVMNMITSGEDLLPSHSGMAASNQYRRGPRPLRGDHS